MAPARAASSPSFTPSTPSSRPKTGVKLAVDPRPVAMASTTRTATAATFATVKTFWTRAPVRRPVTFSQVRAAITTRPTAWAVEAANGEEHVRLADPGQEEAQGLGEGHRHRGHEAGVDREQERPAVE